MHVDWHDLESCEWHLVSGAHRMSFTSRVRADKHISTMLRVYGRVHLFHGKALVLSMGERPNQVLIPTYVGMVA